MLVGGSLVRAPIRVLLVDDYEPWRRFVRSALEKRPDLLVIGELCDGLQAVQQAESLQPELVLLDIGLPSLNGIDVSRQIRKLVPRAVILFLTQESSSDIVEEALQFGSGYVLKINAAEMMDAISEVLHGRKFVSSTLAAKRSSASDSCKNKSSLSTEQPEGTYRVDMDSPLPVNLPEDEQIERILRGTFVGECDDTLAKMYGLNSASDMVGKRMSDMVATDDPKNIELTRQFIRAGYRLHFRKSYEVDIWGNPKVFLNCMTGVLVDGKLIATWGKQSDITEKNGNP